jgi:hypothetical protein
MGNFRLVIDAVGGHGCQREVKDGGTVIGCGRMDCPDCVAGALVTELAKRTGSSIQSASLTHWPGTSSEVVDEFRLDNGGIPLALLPKLQRIRHGSFG